MRMMLDNAPPIKRLKLIISMECALTNPPRIVTTLLGQTHIGTRSK